MKLTIIQKLLFVAFGTMLFACANSKSKMQTMDSGYRLMKTERLTDYKLLTFTSNSDTILVVAKINATEKCISENLFYTLIQGNSRINSLNDHGEEISFAYYEKGGENNNLKILTGSEKPGSNKRQIISYNCLPYYIDVCK